MEKKQYYAICLDEYAMVSFCSFTKNYYGTEDDMMQFAKALEKNSNMPDLVQSLNEFCAGNKNVQYYAAYNNHRLATPVIFHPENHFILNDYAWEHLNIYGFPYYMHADKIEIEQAIIRYENEFIRCAKMKFINLSYKDEYSKSGKEFLTGHFLGHPQVYKVDKQNRKNIIIEGRFFVQEDKYKTLKEAKEHLSIDDLNFKPFMDDIFGDG